MKNENSKKKPFFASFLEKQIKDPETIQGGAVTTPLTDIVSDTTRDVATSPTFDNATLPTRDHLVTLKYPSDNDEAGI